MTTDDETNDAFLTDPTGSMLAAALAKIALDAATTPAITPLRRQSGTLDLAAAEHKNAIQRQVGDDELFSATKGKDFELHMDTLAKVVEVHDGDTVRIVIRYGGALQQYVARISGYDSPEVAPLKSAPSRDEVVMAGRLARDVLAGRLERDANIVLAQIRGSDKYGRLLVTLLTPDGAEDHGAWMVRNLHGLPYNGGTKASPEEMLDMIRRQRAAMDAAASAT